MDPMEDVAQMADLVREKLGPRPLEALAALLDYGLDDADIERLCGLDGATIRRLRRACEIFGLRDPE